MSEIYTNQVMEVEQDSKNLALLMWVGTIFLGFIPGLVFYLIKKEDEYILAHAKEALNWSITILIGYAVAFALTFIFIGALLIPLIGLCNLIFCILGAVNASKAKAFRVPMTLRFIK